MVAECLHRARMHTRKNKQPTELAGDRYIEMENWQKIFTVSLVALGTMDSSIYKMAMYTIFPSVLLTGDRKGIAAV